MNKAIRILVKHDILDHVKAFNGDQRDRKNDSFSLKRVARPDIVDDLYDKIKAICKHLNIELIRDYDAHKFKVKVQKKVSEK